MQAYIYQGDIYCDLCAKAHMTGNDTGDSDQYPQGPYPDGGGEADTPQHCADCNIFLENPLTDDGLKYARDKVLDNDGDRDVLMLWRDFYDIEFPELKLTVTASGKDRYDLAVALDEVKSKIEEGYLSGQDSNEDGDYHFQLKTEVPVSEDFVNRPSHLSRIHEMGDRFVVGLEKIYFPYSKINAVAGTGDSIGRSVMVVALIANEYDEYAAYIGGVDPSKGEKVEGDDLDWIAALGFKLTYKEAKNYFPWIQERYYRR